MQELINAINESEDIPVFMKAAYFHVRFEHIHPFSDGNGRTGRTLLNYFLLISNYPPLIVYEEDRKAYYHALERYDDCDETDEMIRFLEYSLISAEVRTPLLHPKGVPSV